MNLKTRFKYWWLAQTRKMYLRAGGEIYKMRHIVMPADSVELQDEMQFECPCGAYEVVAKHIRSQLAARIAEKMTEAGLIRFESYRDAMAVRGPMCEKNCIRARVLVLRDPYRW